MFKLGMDSFFKAAVCDLDKLLDDFELSSEEPTVHCSSSTSSWPSSETSAVSTNLPNLNLLHYGSPSHFPEQVINLNCTTEESEAKVQPLTAVDLLSSVNRRQTKPNAPPCPDRALKPVCDLVNDTSSAILNRANNHDAFGELDVVEKQMEQEETLLVVFDRPLVSGKHLEGNDEANLCECNVDKTLSDQTNEQISHLATLDIILPLSADQSSDAVQNSVKEQTESIQCDELASRCYTQDSSVNQDDKNDGQFVECIEEIEQNIFNKEEKNVFSDEASETQMYSQQESSDDQTTGLSCLPLAVSMCGALVNNTGHDSEQAEDHSDGASECTEADRPSAGDSLVHKSCYTELAESTPTQSEFARLSPIGCDSDDLLPENSKLGLGDAPEFGFEYLPESDQAEMLVTDEELDAFLQAHIESNEVRRVSCSKSVESPAQIPESGLDKEKPMKENSSETFEGISSSVGEQTNLPPVERNLKLGAVSDPSSTSASEETSLSTSDSFQSPHNISIEHGGARPKTLHCQNSRSSPPPAEEAEGVETTTTTSATHPSVVEVTTASPTSSSETEETNECISVNSHQDQDNYCLGYDELSEPLPYPDEVPTSGAQSAEWKEEVDLELGNKQPAWVPDAEAPNCMNCSQKFTFTRRRHHCRACGKVFCAVCCNRKCKLKYLEKEARVCVVCFDSIRRAEALERMMSPTGPSPNPNVPSEYCSTIPPLQQARAAGTLNSPPPTVMVPVSVLKHPTTDSCPREHKRVWFADGILPNGEFADTTKLSVTTRRSGEMTPDHTPSPTGSDSGNGEQLTLDAARSEEMAKPLLAGPWDVALLSAISSSVKKVHSLLPENVEELPPLLITTGENEVGDVLVEECPAPCQILHLLEEGGPRPLMFVLNANLLVNVKIVSYDGRQCWCFGSTGLQALGQKELVFLLECLPEEKTLPQDIFTLYLNIYQDAKNGKFLEELDNITFTSSFLGSKDHAGMLFFSPSSQPLDGLSLPPQPFLFGLLIQKLEVPWAKVFPLRLLLRLGSEYDVYPTTLTSVRFRESVYRETGHTIMNLLSDLRNYQYSLTVVEGLQILMEMGRSYINIPKSSFSEMLKVVNSSNEHVISVGATFSPEADSHLVCFQNEDGNHQTQANSVPGKTRAVTGASFVVFNGALKPSSGFIAKSSIVEDGLMVQIPPETMESLRLALKEQRDFDIPCGKSDEAEVRETVTVRWIDWSSPVNKGKSSAVDGRRLDGVHSLRVQQDTDFTSDGFSIRCTEVFCEPKAPDTSHAAVMASCGGFQKDVALATCSALTPHLSVLVSRGINAVSLRVSTQADMVEYQAGSGGQLLPQRYMNDLDSALIPVIHGGSASVPQTDTDLEFVFYITNTLQ